MTEKELLKELLKEMYAPEDVDKQMIKESVKNYYGRDDLQNDYDDAYCLDLGANIGAFAILAVKLGASKVVCVECDPRNLEILYKNVEDYPEIEVIEAAVVPYSCEDKTIKIYKSNAKSNHSSTSILKRTRNFKEYAEVETRTFHYLMIEDGWDFVKIDIEGAEVDAIDISNEAFMDIPFKFIEFHKNSKNADKVKSLMKALREDSNEHIENPVIYFNSINGYDCTYIKYRFS